MQVGLSEKCVEAEGRLQGTGRSQRVDRSLKLRKLLASPLALLDDRVGSIRRAKRGPERKPLIRRKRDERIGVLLDGLRFTAKLVHHGWPR